MSNSEEMFYDALIEQIDIDANQTFVKTADGQLKTFPKASKFHAVGARGVLKVKADGDFVFWAYTEQRLRRWPERDVQPIELQSYAGLWGWRLDGLDDLIATKPGFIPGRDGRYVEDETEKVEIDVPPEFFELCQARGISVEQALRGLVADVCGLQNYVDNPREDGFGSNGSDERMYAQQWFDRAYFL
jgi:hypothetical protein